MKFIYLANAVKVYVKEFCFDKVVPIKIKD